MTMDADDELLARELRASLEGSGRKTAFEDAVGKAAGTDDNPLESDFFRALNAFRAARTSGDREAMAAAERHLQDVVRAELTGE